MGSRAAARDEAWFRSWPPPSKRRGLPKGPKERVRATREPRAVGDLVVRDVDGHPVRRRPVDPRSDRPERVPLLVPVGRLARLQPLDAAGHDLGEAPGAGTAPVEAADQPPVDEHLVSLAEA